MGLGVHLEKDWMVDYSSVSISSTEDSVLLANTSCCWLRSHSGAQMNSWPTCDVDVVFRFICTIPSM